MLEEGLEQDMLSGGNVLQGDQRWLTETGNSFYRHGCLAS